MLAAIQADMRITFEQCSIAQWRNVGIGERFIGAVGGHNRVDFNFAAFTCGRINATTKPIDWAAKIIGNPPGMVKTHGVLIIDPLQRHPCCICPEYLLR